MAAHDGPITGIAFNADGSLLATTGDEGALHVWDMPVCGARVETITGDGAATRQASTPMARSSLRCGPTAV